MTDIFISYSRKDKPWVQTLAASLVAEGYDVWWDPEILPGQDYETVIKQALDSCKCVVTVWSKDSIDSTWVRAESTKGLSRKVYVPVLYHDVEPPMQFGHIQSADLQNWKGKTTDPRYQQLLRAITVHTEPSTEPTPLEPKRPKPLGWAVGALAIIGMLGAGYVAFNEPNTQQQVVADVSLPVQTDDGQLQPVAQEKLEDEKAKQLEEERAQREKQAKAEAQRLEQIRLAEAQAKAKKLAEKEAKEKLAQQKKAKQKKLEAEKAKLLEEEQTQREKEAKAEAQRLEQVRLAEEEAKAKKLAEKEAKEKLAQEKKAKQKKQTRIGQYIDNGDGTITDTKTKLMWKKCSEGLSGKNCEKGKAKNYKWDEAIKHGKAQPYFAGKTGWRVPTIDELRSLVYCSNGTPQKEAWKHSCSGANDKAGDYERPTINQKAFPNTEYWYWSSSPYKSNASGAWVVYFNNGYDGWYFRNYNRQVRLVRSGQ